ncbi:ubiquinol-cytochrome c reductase iron-sulfur subunit [Actinocrinis sp.]|uniref:cytochrome bc1 complex Rieske iron-sulfur subunit n=1 Tax=Actinocrinis sp. TaxID=1920516 RepID=UPI002C12165F|nr:Rieske 2Fe-2S domain-containing protein [Actinocrinis sp.]HXR70849.1 Rieske 2Fe-2S domain-containing protein [Actinocrinis sp.]
MTAEETNHPNLTELGYDEHSPVRLDEHADGHGHEVALPQDPFADPGLEPHRPRASDIDETVARRKERQVAGLFALSALCTIGVMVAYTEVPRTAVVNFFPIGAVSASNFALGLLLGIALFALGAGAVYWARTLMTDVEFPQERHPLESDTETKAQAAAEFRQGVEDSGIKRRPLIRRTLLGALAVLPLPALWMLRDLGPLPGDSLRSTAWKPNERIINDMTVSLDGTTGRGIKPEDITIGSLVQGRPEAALSAGEDLNNLMAKSAILLVRMDPADIKSQKERDWGYQGIVAFSKICTHVGCPVSLYEQQTHHMLCPCHQSTFDLSEDGKVIFGPAARSLPQLPITVDADGYLVAKSDFDQPVGPSFWERG